MCACGEVLTCPLVTKVCAGSRMIRLYIYMKLIFLCSETEILLKEITQKASETGVSVPVFVPGNDWLVDIRG